MPSPLRSFKALPKKPYRHHIVLHIILRVVLLIRVNQRRAFKLKVSFFFTIRTGIMQLILVFLKYRVIPYLKKLLLIGRELRQYIQKLLSLEDEHRTEHHWNSLDFAFLPVQELIKSEVVVGLGSILLHCYAYSCHVVVTRGDDDLSSFQKVYRLIVVIDFFLFEYVFLGSENLFCKVFGEFVEEAGAKIPLEKLTLW